jgi:pimeloyl-ACP methyl ester carboxylesterase
MSRIRWRPMMAILVGLSVSPIAANANQNGRWRSFDAKGVKLHFVVEGEGEPVVLLHGLQSTADINWRLTGVIRDLASDHRVIALDLPGHGRSDKPENPEAYGRQMAEDVVLLLDHLKIKKAHVVGYSLGGMIAFKLLAMHPDRVLSGTIGGMGWFREGSRLQEIWGEMRVSEGSHVPAALIHSLGELALSEKELQSIDVPIKVVVGDRDPVKQLYVAPMRRKRRDWPIVEIADAGHINCILKKQFREEMTGGVRAAERAAKQPRQHVAGGRDRAASRAGQ